MTKQRTDTRAKETKKVTLLPCETTSPCHAVAVRYHFLSNCRIRSCPLANSHDIFSLSARTLRRARLFSTFGSILIKVRNRMGKETLQRLTEIKMNICDGYIAHGGMKTPLKCCFGTVDVSASQDLARRPLRCRLQHSWRRCTGENSPDGSSN